MTFLNFALLSGLAAVSIPIILHLLNRRSAKIVDWGAMRFLLDSLLSRKKRIQLEEALLMASRCLLVCLLALCVARPFVPPGSQIPWVVVLPTLLLGVAMAAVTTVMWPEKHLRWKLFGVTAALFLLGGGAVGLEKWLNLRRLGTGGRRDIALIIDGSTSMSLKSGGTTAFDQAVREADKIISDAGGGSAFSLILGAPVPQAKIPTPIVNRADLKEALSTLRPVNGRMAAFDALSLAAISLSQGNNPQKEIIVLTDAQDVGWELDKPARWEALKKGFENLKTTPSLVIRQFPLPPSLRNVGVAGLKYLRETIGTDRPVTVEVSLTNTGTEAVTPAGVELKIGEKVYTDSSVSQMLPGTTETVRFQHKFDRPGSYVVSAKVNVEDDLAPDDQWDAVCEVQDKIKTLIVAGDPLAAIFAWKALSPAKFHTASDGIISGKMEQPLRDVVDCEVKTLAQMTAVNSLADYDVVMLCDVPSLAPSSARMVAQFVEAGGGLLISPGPKTNAGFFNEWRTPDGQPVVPLRLIEQKIVADAPAVAPAPSAGTPAAAAAAAAAADPPGVRASLNTFTYPALKLVANAKESDLGTALFQRYWRLAEGAGDGAGVFVGGRFASGDPFLAARRLGQGAVLLLGASLDATGSNLATRHAFVPLVHEMIYHLATPGGQRMNLAPAYAVNVPLSRAKTASGLRGEYFDASRPNEAVFSRVDQQLNFNWQDKGPAPGFPVDNFRVRWSGSVVPKYTEEYLFQPEADDSADVFVNDEMVWGQKRRKDRIELIAGKPVSLRVEFTENNGNAGIKLLWQSPTQRREVVPADCLLPYAPGAEKTFESLGGTFEAIGPDALPRTVDLVYSRTGTFARLKDDVVPGLYQISVPESRKSEFPGLFTAEGKLPFTVTADAGEGKIKPLPEEAYAFFQKYANVLRPKSLEDTIAILQGKQFGEELWKYLALGALFLILCEIALTRWIAIQRQSGNETKIDFEDRFQPNKAFTEAVERVKQAV